MWQNMYDELVRNMKRKGIPLEVKIMPKEFTKNMRIARFDFEEHLILLIINYYN